MSGVPCIVHKKVDKRFLCGPRQYKTFFIYLTNSLLWFTIDENVQNNHRDGKYENVLLETKYDRKKDLASCKTAEDMKRYLQAYKKHTITSIHECTTKEDVIDFFLDCEPPMLTKMDEFRLKNQTPKTLVIENITPKCLMDKQTVFGGNIGYEVVTDEGSETVTAGQHENDENDEKNYNKNMIFKLKFQYAKLKMLERLYKDLTKKFDK
eukprot:UN04980